MKLRYEYDTTYVSIGVCCKENRLPCNEEGAVLSSDVEMLVKNGDIQKHLNNLALEGWEMLSHQPVMGLLHRWCNLDTCLPVAVPMLRGYLFFWRRLKEMPVI